MHSFVDTPVGTYVIVIDGDGALARLQRVNPRPLPSDSAWGEWNETAGRDVQTQLAQYFAGTRREFELPLAPKGTPFQQEVWEAMLDIPYGETVSYGEIATSIGRPTSSRAVGGAIARTPIGIVVPCHRVVGASGDLVGYGGGVDTKRLLLAHEQENTTRIPARR